MNKRIMILGSLFEFKELARMARERGIYTVVCDGNPKGPAKAYADAVYDIDVTDIDGIAEICKKERVDSILTAFSDLLLECMVKICDKAKLPCYLSVDKLKYYRDKRAMKQMFAELGISSPRHITFKKNFDISLLKDFKTPLIAKPVDRYGSRGIAVYESSADIAADFERICGTSEIKEIIVEEYNDGYEFNAMAWLCKGKLTLLGIADREKTKIDAETLPISTRNIYPSRFFNEIREGVEDILSRVAAYTGQTDGELSMQFFWTPQEGIAVGEVAARFLGYEHELIEYAGGISLEKLMLDSIYDRLSMEKTLASYDPAMEKSAAVIYFQAKPGIVGDMSAFERIKGISGVRLVETFYSKGERSALYARPYAARVCICADTRENTDELSEKLLKKASVLDTEGRELLYPNNIGRYVI